MGYKNNLRTGSVALRDVYTAASLSAKCVRLVRSSWKKYVTEYFGYPKEINVHETIIENEIITTTIVYQT